MENQQQHQMTHEQYESVLKYMETTGEQDFQTAQLILKQHSFNVNTAINSRFNNNMNNNNFGYQNNGRQDFQEENQDNNDEEVVRKMIQHIQRENQNWNIVSVTFGFAKNLIVGVLKYASQIFLPQILLSKLIRSDFYNLYRRSLRINFQDEKLDKILNKTRQFSYKACFLVISEKRTHECIVNLLNRIQISNKIHENFFFIGYVQGNKDISILQKQKPLQPPQIIICRYNAFKQVIILERIIGEQSIAAISVEKLNKISQQSRNLFKKDKNVLIKYRNFIRRRYYGPMYMQQQEEQEINFVARQQTSQQIRQQNQLYKKIQQQSLLQQKLQQQKKLQQQLEKHKIQEIVQQRKVRKLSIPDEPNEGQIIRLIFRCPDGSTKVRNFQSDQKIQLIYNWVQTNQEIQLQDNQKRQFQILYSYPPKPLTDMKDKLLKDVFESEQEKILIREL